MGLHSQGREDPFDLVVVIVDYALAPEKTCPGAVIDAVNSYDWHMKKTHFSPKRTVLAGESAGGGLVAATLLGLQNKTLFKDHQSELVNPENSVLPAAGGKCVIRCNRGNLVSL